MIAEGETQLGKGYVWGSIPDPSDPNPAGFDCSGFTRWLTHRYGFTNVPTGSEGQYEEAYKQGILRGGVNDLDAVQPGDLVFFDTAWRGGGLCDGRSGSDPVDGCPNRASHVGIFKGYDAQGNPIVLQAGGGSVSEVNAYQMYDVNGNIAPILGVASPGAYGPPSGGYYA